MQDIDYKTLVTRHDIIQDIFNETLVTSHYIVLQVTRYAMIYATHKNVCDVFLRQHII